MPTETQVALKFLRLFRAEHFDQCEAVEDGDCLVCVLYCEAIGLDWEVVQAIKKGEL